ncbi:hypothetical protein EYC80_003156 [Monilinia laxa]|uniref:Secreted protein n=1 Tax=Monilinia laxa TaxID=61186 RepID=A0A5N6KCY4_MONLA|nr:hypothetical protein EYC80_003156 [Monilinia laxa]
MRSSYFFCAASSLVLSPVLTGLGAPHVWPSRVKSWRGFAVASSAGEEVGAAETMAGRTKRSAEATIGENFILIDFLTREGWIWMWK